MTRFYGGDGTIHSTGEVNVELDKDGKVVAVWFRCSMLQFTQHVVDEHRAGEMRSLYEYHKAPGIYGITFEDAALKRVKEIGP